MDTTRPLHIAVDMDCTIADFFLGLDEALDAAGDRARGIRRFRDGGFTSYGLTAGLTADQAALIEEIMCTPGFFENLLEIAGARRVLHELQHLGHHVTIASTPWDESATCASEKYAWVARVLGVPWRRRTALLDDKTTLRPDVLIDDKPDITGHHVPHWRQLIFGTYAYNAHVPGPRLTRWTTAQAVLDLIEELA
ncbi:MAG: hypothetical protein J0J04_07620 [Microbacterium sp.]|uniref:5' nucleotidase, NT5C type n=1 Tax=Microbacterium sp. TaxID=51671 RepID=UPI001AC628A3|nr:hypothetical protein [Microbacterium sp.]MBN9214666.1 hypothetical protein [Microbacterium sp.]